MAVISEPAQTVYQRAVAHAELLRETENDPYDLAHMVLYLAEQNKHLETIAEASEEYIRFSLD